MASTDPTTFTATTLLTGALRKTGQYAPGETPSPQDLNDALDVLNGHLDSMSLDNKSVFNSMENVVTLTAGQQSYTIGNEYAGVFNGTVTSGSNIITGVTTPQVGTNGSASALLIPGAVLTGPGIPTGTVVAPGGVGTNTVTMSTTAVGTFTNLVSYTAPGQIAVQRPLKITNAYSRITTTTSTVDFFCDIKDLSAYSSIGLKSQPGPWAKFLYYNPNMPQGQVYFWPVPNQAVEFHFWTTQVLQSVSLNTPLNLPQGYYIYLQFAIAELLCVEFGTPVPPDIIRLARRYEAQIKSNNAFIDQQIAVDQAIAAHNANDAGWVLTGGFQ